MSNPFSYEQQMEAAVQKAAVEAALEADREKSLRDAFAGAALGALIARSAFWDRPDIMAKRAFEQADAMMKARTA